MCLVSSQKKIWLKDFCWQANVASTNDIANFVKKTNFNKKLIESNKKVTSNKTKYVDAEKKLNDCNFIHKTNKSCFRGS